MTFKAGDRVLIPYRPSASLVEAQKSELYGTVVGPSAYDDGCMLVVLDKTSKVEGNSYLQLSRLHKGIVNSQNIHDVVNRRYQSIWADSLELEAGIKSGARFSSTPRSLNVHPGVAAICFEVEPDKTIYGTVVGASTYSKNMSILMMDEGTEFGYLLKDISVASQVKIRELNIPNVETRRFIHARYNRFRIEPDTETRTKENTMSNKVVEMVKGDAKEAAYRVAGTQITNGVKLAVIKLFESKGGKSDQMVMLKEVLDSEVGDSLISLLLGFGLNYAPGIKNDPRVQKLSEEFRINGMSVAGNAVMGVAMESLLPVITGALKALPEEATSKPRIVDSSEEEEEEEIVPPVRASKRAGG